MRQPHPPTRARFAAVALSYLCALGGLLPAAAPRAHARPSSPAPAAAAAESHSVRQLLLPAKDLVVDPATQTIFASLPSIAGPGGNSLAPIDPAAATVGTPIFVGSEPNQLALSDDGKTLYVALDGAAAVRRFDLTTRTPGLQFSLGYEGSSGALYVDDMAVQPGSPGTLAVSRRPGHSGSASIAVFDDGVRRAAASSSFDFPDIAFDPNDPARLYTLSSSTLRRLALTPAGLAADGSVGLAGSGEFTFQGGRLYTAGGRVFDPATGALLGSFTGEGIYAGTKFFIDAQAGRAYFVTAPNSGGDSFYTATVRAFDLQTFLPVGTLEIPGARGAANALVRWGSNGLAFSTLGGQVFIIQTTLVPSTDPVPTPSPTPALTPTPTPTPPLVPANARQLQVTANDLVYDPARQVIYASVPSRPGAGGNSVVAVDPAAETVGAPVFVGSEPNRLARSDDGQFLYVALDGAAAVRRVDLNTQTAGLQFSLGNSDGNTGPHFVDDMEVAPGEPHTIAVSRRNAGFSPKHEGVAVYDDGVRRAAATPRHTGSNAIEYSASAATLYGYETDSSSNAFRKMAVDAAGVSVAQVTSGVGLLCCNTIEYDAGRVYFTSGRVIDPETAAPLGTFPVGGNAPFVIPDTAAGRVYFAGGGGFSDDSFNGTVFITAYDANTFLPVGRAQVAGVNGRVRNFIRWGANGFAFSTSAGQLFLVRTPLVPSSEPPPSATPTPTITPVPSPTPAPTPAPGQFRQVALATNDIIYEPTSQTIFASVPSSAGAGGNSVTPINPAAGTAGTPVAVGSEPNKLAVSDDGQFLYVGLDGAGAVARVDVATRTAGPPFSLGSSGSQPYLARDIAVAPGQPNTIAVVRRPGTSSPSLAVYDGGVRRPVVTNTFATVTAAEFSSSPEVLYGYNGDSSEFGLRRIAVAPCGVVPLRTTQNVLSGFNLDFKVDNGVAYSVYGRTVEPEAPALLGTFSFVTSVFTSPPYLMAAEAKAGRVYYLLNENGFVLRVFDNKTFLKVGELRLPGVTGTVSSLVRWGSDGLAFRSSAGQVYLLQHPLIGGTDPSFVPAPAPAPATFTAAGRVFSNNGDPAGTQIAVTGAGTGATVTADANGDFSIAGLPPCGGYTLTPSKPGYVFTPASTTVSDPSAQQFFNFNATLKTIGFTQSARTVSEGAGRVLISVTRNAGTDQPASVSYETTSGTASDRSDFNTTLGTLQFAAGEASKTVTVLLSDDALVEGPETFSVTLKDPQGAALAQGFSNVTVTVTDNDASQTEVSPLADARFFVAQHYRDFLNRNAADDPAGFDFWSNQLADCSAQADPTAKANCLEDRRINVSAAFFLSIEFQQTGFLVHRLYAASFADTAARPKGLPRFREFLSDTQEIGRGVVVNVGNWEAQLESNKQAFVLAFVQRPEFAAAHPEGLAAGEFADRLFANAGATPTAAERASAVAAFGAGGTAGRAAALRSVAESKSVSDRQFNSAFVLMQYFGYLRRGPNELPDADFSGYQFWLDKLNQFGDFRSAEMVKAFLVSLEYQRRFGPTTFDIRK